MLEMGAYSLWQWLVLCQYELLLFAGIFFFIGSLDEALVDLAYLWMKLSGKAITHAAPTLWQQQLPLRGRAAVFIAAWQEHEVIGTTIAHLLASWRHSDLRLYVGVYRNDEATLLAAMQASGGDGRLRIVIHDANGPTTKADCLNRLYRAMIHDETVQGIPFRMVIMHDAEDMVDAAALTVMDGAMEGADLVQLPVLALPQEHSRWVGSHYCEEFAEAHGKTMVVRDALRAGIPLAGVGCAISRTALARSAEDKPGAMPFSQDCLTEDYELGLGISSMGGRGRFVRARREDGSLVATRAYFPSELGASVRQKTRWMHGIALQGWDRLGWGNGASAISMAELWMRLRDRRGPFSALILVAAYGLILLSGFLWALEWAGFAPSSPLPEQYRYLLWANFAGFLWRLVFRFAFTAREFGLGEGLWAIVRIPFANIIAIMAARRAMAAYVKTLMGAPVVWDKTEHKAHPAFGLTPSSGVPA